MKVKKTKISEPVKMMNELWRNETTTTAAATLSLSSSFLAREETLQQDMLFMNCSSRPGNPSHDSSMSVENNQYVWFHLGFISSKLGNLAFLNG